MLTIGGMRQAGAGRGGRDGVDFPPVDNSVGRFGGVGKGSAKLSEA